MYCEDCGAEIPDDSNFCPECGKKFHKEEIKSEKNMIPALIISFILPGLGIAYAGNLKKGIGIFVISLILGILGFGLSFLKVIVIILWIFALYLTYVEVKKANGDENPDILEDFKALSDGKKVGAAIVVLVILLIAVAGIIDALSPHDDTLSYDYSTDLDSSPSQDYSVSDSSSGSYSSSSNGHDVNSHYEGDGGSADTHGTIYDDGSVESHQTGHTDYGDYRIDSYMDSDGNVHGTVDVGGHTYHVNS